MGSTHLIVTLAIVAFVLHSPIAAAAVSNDAQISYHRGLAAQAKGDESQAFSLFKSSCIENDGSAAACMAWAKLAEKRVDRKAY